MAAAMAALTFTACKKDDTKPNNADNGGGNSKLLRKVPKLKTDKPQFTTLAMMVADV